MKEILTASKLVEYQCGRCKRTSKRKRNVRPGRDFTPNRREDGNDGDYGDLYGKKSCENDMKLRHSHEE